MELQVTGPGQPVLLIGRSGQVASAVQRLAPALLPQRPLLVVGRPQLDLAAVPTAPDATAPAAGPSLEHQFRSLLELHRPALVINAAAYTAVDRAETEAALAMAVNGDAVGVIARLCAERSLPLFHISTDYVFAGDGERPWSPGDPPNPLGVYGASKLAGERQLLAARGEALLLRVSWVFGQQGANFVRTMVRLAAERPLLRVVDDQVGGPTSAEAIAGALLRLVEPAIANCSPLTGPFPWGIQHYAGQPAVSWHGFAQEIIDQALELGLISKAPELLAIPSSDYPLPAPRPLNSRLDCSGFSRAFGLPLPFWREDLRQCLESWR
jgi:dTDP-4-dehydrorhamnose reductase